MSDSKILTSEEVEAMLLTVRADGLTPLTLEQRDDLLATVRQLLSENEKLMRERAELQNALLPFALLDIKHLSDRSDTEPIWAINKSQITNGHIRTSQRLIQEAVDREIK